MFSGWLRALIGVVETFFLGKQVTESSYEMKTGVGHSGLAPKFKDFDLPFFLSGREIEGGWVSRTVLRKELNFFSP